MPDLDLVGIGHVLYDVRCYVDDYPKPEKTTIIKENLKNNVGGSATNVAVNCSRLGLKTAIIGKIGDDHHGQFISSELLKRRIDLDGLRVDSKNPTGISILIINKYGKPAVMELVGANEPLGRKDISVDTVKRARFLHMSGTSIGALEYASKKAGENAFVSFDPGRSKSALGWEALSKILENVDLVVVNRLEICQLAQIKETEKIEKAASILKREFGLKIIVKTGEGTYVFGDAARKIPIFRVPIVDLIGAGDAFTSGLLSSLSWGKPLEQAVVFGNALMAYKVQREGAEVPFTRRVIERTLAQLKK